MSISDRKIPNVLITGTPGTGKTTLSELLATVTGFQHIVVGDLVKQKELHDGYDEEFDTYILNEDKLNDELEDMLVEGGKIVDFHSCEVFPERFFDIVVLLQTDNSKLYKRLAARGYSQKKITENVECEIMQVVMEEVYDSYKEEIIIRLPSDTVEQMEQNISVIQEKIESYIQAHSA
ncbi:factor activating pos9 [Entomophthora muscae]|uniref:Factor activating pos9 n=1 Tax=Entomophthora muscae TaxID=34485 RepID=A0ACC2TEU8_9FUNG|nr:factor activating pos9 [Entomophthora muscae]